MILTLKGKLTVEDKKALLETMLKVNEASNWLSQKVFNLKTVNAVKVHHETYRELRERFGLPASYACAVIRRVCNAYKRRKKKERFKKVIGFRKLATIDLNKDLFVFRGFDKVGITTVNQGRQVYPIQFGEYYGQRLQFKRNTGQLIYRKDIDAFFVTVSAEIEKEPTILSNGWLGIDVGIKNIAVDSLGNFCGGEELVLKRENYKEKRRQLQKKKALKRKLSEDNHSVRRALRRTSKKLRNFVRTVTHTVAKRLVADAKTLSLGIALENLKGARERITATARRRERYQRASWSYYLLQQFIVYKATLKGVPVTFVNPKNTSRTCPICGCVDKKNRKSQAEFVCRLCGYSNHADFVAALNIMLRAQGTNHCPQMPEGFNPLLGQGRYLKK